MKNPGLDAFAAATTYVHPGKEDIRDPADPDYADVDDPDEWGEFSEHHDFGRWRTPGQSIRVPIRQGPVFTPEQAPENVLHGEVLDDATNRIINGEHESDQPSANPFVAKAQHDLRTPGSDVAVSTLSGLLRGQRPDSMSMETAHNWLSRYFIGVRVNPSRGTLMTQSPVGSQMVKYKAPEQPEQAPAVELHNDEGVFKSEDPQRIIRTMLAFQIAHNSFVRQQKKKKDDDDQNGLNTTSGLFHNFMEGFNEPRPFKAPEGAAFEPGRGTEFAGRVNGKDLYGGYVMPTHSAPANWYHNGLGTSYSPNHDMKFLLDRDLARQPVADSLYPGHTYTYSPNPETGHVVQRQDPRGKINYWVQDKVHPAAQGTGFDHPPEPAPAPRPGAGPVGRRRGRPSPPPPADVRPVSALPARPSAPAPAEFPTSEDKWPVPTHPRSWPTVLPEDPSEPTGYGPQPTWHHGAVQVNDLCPVCASGYLEPYDKDFHECLNCGSLVRHVGFEKAAAAAVEPSYWDTPRRVRLEGSKHVYVTGQHDPQGRVYISAEKSDIPRHQNRSGWHHENWLTPVEGEQQREAAARPKGGLGRGLTGPSQIPPAVFREKENPFYQSQPGVGEDDPNQVDEDLSSASYHPLAGEEPDPDAEPAYVAPTQLREKGQVKRKQGAADPIGEFMGKNNFSAIHRPGQSQVYAMPDPDLEGAFFRVTEGAANPQSGKRAWVLTHDSTQTPETWKRHGEPYVNDRGVPVTTMPQAVPSTTLNDKRKRLPMSLPDLGDRALTGYKTFVASGTHPVESDSLNRAIRDVGQHGRNSQTYLDAVNKRGFRPPDLPSTEDGLSQRDLRMYSSVGNPGLARFAAPYMEGFGDPSQFDEDKEHCTHCSGSGVDPEYGDECAHCDGSGYEPE